MIIALGLLLSAVSWAFLGMTVTNLLSGSLETRTCLTDCVRNYYYLAGASGFVGLLLAALAWLRSGFSGGTFLGLVVIALPFGVFAGIYMVGTLGSLAH
ncbi:MAG: hypothetical protein ABW076_18405 [Candidatus Thiodiazotropha sp.]